MTTPFRDAPVFRIWECDKVFIDLERITMCQWSTCDSGDYCECDYEDHEPKTTLDVYFMGDGESLELSITEGQSLLEAWRAYRRA